MEFLCSSGDSTARIWTIADGPSGTSAQTSAPRPLVLKHFKGKTNEKSKDVTTLDWNVSLVLLVMLVRGLTSARNRYHVSIGRGCYLDSLLID